MYSEVGLNTGLEMAVADVGDGEEVDKGGCDTGEGVVGMVVGEEAVGVGD